MGLVKNFIDLILHLDKYLSVLIQNFGNWVYAILFIIIFLETGIVLTPFLPGDSILFAAGAFSGVGTLNVWVLFFSLSFAAIAGDTLNYSIGKFLGSKAFEKYPKVFKKQYLDKTHSYYEKYGANTIVLARFVPIVRTFAPFIAGVGKMSYMKFLTYNVLGGIFWVGFFVFTGYFFGDIQIVKDNFGSVIIVIMAVSLIPILVEFIRYRKSGKRQP